MNSENTTHNPGYDGPQDEPNITQQNRGQRQNVSSDDEKSISKTVDSRNQTSAQSEHHSGDTDSKTSNQSGGE